MSWKRCHQPGLLASSASCDEGLGLLVGDAVGLQQQLEVGDFERDLGHLHAADRGGGDAQDARGLLALEPGAFPQVQQTPAEDDLADRRRGPRFTHAPPPRRVLTSRPEKNADSPAAPFEDPIRRTDPNNGFERIFDDPNWRRAGCCCEQCATAFQTVTQHSAIFRVTLAKCSRRGDSGKRDSVRALRNRRRRRPSRARRRSGREPPRGRCRAPVPFRAGRTSGFPRPGQTPDAGPADGLVGVRGHAATARPWWCPSWSPTPSCTRRAPT